MLAVTVVRTAIAWLWGSRGRCVLRSAGPGSGSADWRRELPQSRHCCSAGRSLVFEAIRVVPTAPAPLHSQLCRHSCARAGHRRGVYRRQWHSGCHLGWLF